MELGTKLKFCVALSVLAVILKIIVTASPGWVVVKKDVMVDPALDIYPEDDGLSFDAIPELMKPEKQRVTIHFGLWYYKVCKCSKKDKDDDDDSSEENSHENSDEKPEKSDDDDESRRKHHHKRHGHHGHHRCYHRSYHRNREDYVNSDHRIEEMKDNEIPAGFSQARDFINDSVEYARHARHELVWYVSCGLVFAIVGLIGSIVFARGNGSGKHSGRLACSTQILSAFFFWVTINKVGTYIIQMKMIQDHEGMEGRIPKDVMFGAPWCLCVAAAGASIMALVSLFHLIMVSRDKKTEVSEYSFKKQDKIPIFAPKGYEQLIVPTIEAGPLPEKQPVV